MRGRLHLLVCAALSAGGHAVLAAAIARLPGPPVQTTFVPMEVRTVPAPPPPAPPPPPPAEEIHEPPAPTPPKPRLRRAVPVPSDQPKSEPPPTERPAVSGPTTPTPVFGVAMDSSSQGGVSVPSGNTLQTAPGARAKGPVAPLAAAAPVAAHEVTRMPMPRGNCSGKYTDAARQAGTEGTVVLDLVVGPDGETRDVTVVAGLPNGLAEAAVTALRACRFTPGERDGEKVAVRVRGFKVHFYLHGSD